jgi:nucleoid-associated protein YgaU
MAFNRTSDDKVIGSDLDAFVENQIKGYSRQLAIRNADDETRFNQLVLEQNLPLSGQLAYRKAQLSRVKDDPDETRRVQKEISALTDKIEQKEYSDAYLDKLISFENGSAGIDSVVDFLKSRLASTTDENVKQSIRESLAKQEGARFALTQQVLDAQTSYAMKDKTVPILDAQIQRVSEARAQSALAGNKQLETMYDLQLQGLTKAKSEAEIEKASTEFAVGTMSGYQNATGLLDSYNARISSASDTGPIDVGGVHYDSARQFWTYKRDSYVADESANGFFGRYNQEKTTALDVKRSNNTLTNDDVRAAATDFDKLTSRPELASYGFKVNANKQDVVQHGADLRAASIENRYTADLDVNRAFADLSVLKGAGANVEIVETSILSKAARLKETQVGNILDVAQSLMKSNPGMTPEAALAEAAKTGAAVVLSPQQLVAKTETEIAGDQAKAAAAGNVGTEPRTTAGAQATKVEAQTAAAPPTTPPIEQNLADKYGIVGKTVYRKSDGMAFQNEAQFFQDSGLTSFQNVKFDTAYQPPVAGASPKLDATPSAPLSVTPPATVPVVPQKYKVNRGDTLTAISQKLLGDPNRYREIAKANNITDPNKILEGQELVIPKK